MPKSPPDHLIPIDHYSDRCADPLGGGLLVADNEDVPSGVADNALTADWVAIAEAFLVSLSDQQVCLQNSRRDREDDLQEAWLLLVNGRLMPPFLDSRENLSAWFAVVVRNRLNDLDRRERRRCFATLTDQAADLRIGREEDPATSFERFQLREAIREVILQSRSHLTELTFQVVALRWIEGRSNAEISLTLAIPATQVRDRHRRAFPVLRDLVIRRLGADFEPARRVSDHEGATR